MPKSICTTGAKKSGNEDMPVSVAGKQNVLLSVRLGNFRLTAERIVYRFQISAKSGNLLYVDIHIRRCGKAIAGNGNRQGRIARIRYIRFEDLEIQGQSKILAFKTKMLHHRHLKIQSFPPCSRGAVLLPWQAHMQARKHNRDCPCCGYHS